ncbi:unnamed protein product [Camellia sinensis]
MTQQEKDVLEIRSYLHDRALIQYGDKLESFGKSLQELLELSTDEISSQLGMKKGHISRFIEKGTSNSSAPDPLQQPPQALTSTRKTSKTSSNNNIHKAYGETEHLCQFSTTCVPGGALIKSCLTPMKQVEEIPSPLSPANRPPQHLTSTKPLILGRKTEEILERS